MSSGRTFESCLPSQTKRLIRGYNGNCQSRAYIRLGAISTNSKNFIIDNGSSYVAEVTFADSLPAVDAPCHKLGAGYGLVRMGVTGAVYGRDSQDDGPNREAWVAVSAEA